MKLTTGAKESENMFYEYRTKIFNELLRDAEINGSKQQELL
jgi:hypothetical protein